MYLYHEVHYVISIMLKRSSDVVFTNIKIHVTYIYIFKEPFDFTLKVLVIWIIQEFKLTRKV